MAIIKEDVVRAAWEAGDESQLVDFISPKDTEWIERLFADEPIDHLPLVEQWQNAAVRETTLARINAGNIRDIVSFSSNVAAAEFPARVVSLFRVARTASRNLGDVRRRLFDQTVVPAILNAIPEAGQELSRNTFNEPRWVALAAGQDAASLLGPTWADSLSYLEGWVRKLLAMDLPIGDDVFGFFKPQSDTPYSPAILHPLVLRVLSEIHEPAVTPLRVEIDRWLYERVFVNPNEFVTVSTAFAVGALLESVGIGHLAIAEKDTILKVIAKNSNGGESIKPAYWRGQQELVRQLVEACPFWHDPDRAKTLRNCAIVESGLDFNKILTGVSEGDNNQNLSLNPLSITRRSLPQYRDNSTGTPWFAPDNSPRKKYQEHLKKMQEEGDTLAVVTKSASGTARTYADERTRFTEAFRNPWLQLALPDQLNPESKVWENTQIGRQILKQQIENTTFASPAYDKGGLLVGTQAWIDTINLSSKLEQPEELEQPEDKAKELLAAWAKLEVWDKLRGRLCMEGDQNAGTAFEQLIVDLDRLWLLDDGTPAPADADINKIRPLLAALAHLGLDTREKMMARATKIDSYLTTRTDLSENQFTALAATYLELGLTMVASGVEIGEAFPKIMTLTDGQAQEKSLMLLNWAQRCCASLNAWEARAGMNLFILLGRLAEVSDDLFFTTPIAKLGGNALGPFVRVSINAVKDGTALPGSDLALAFAAGDLYRYCRERATGLSGLAVKPVWWDGDIHVLIGDLVTSFITPEKFKNIQANAGNPTRLLLLALTRIKLEQHARDRRLAVWPAHSNGRDLHKALQFVDLDTIARLRAALHALCCQEPIALHWFPARTVFNVHHQPGGLDIDGKWKLRRGDRRVVYNAQHKTALDVVKGLAEAWAQANDSPSGYVVSPDPDSTAKLAGLTVKAPEGATEFIDIETPHPRAVSRIVLDENSPWWETRYWAAVYSAREVNFTVNGTEIDETKVPAFRLINWADSFRFEALGDLLATAATLDNAFPDYPEVVTTNTIFAASSEMLRDIDGHYEGEFNTVAIGTARDELSNAATALKTSEKDYQAAIDKTKAEVRASELIEVLRKPLRFETADFKEKIDIALAEVREAEAALEAAEHLSLAAGFETFVSDLMVDVAKLEVQRQAALVEIEAKKGQIADLERQTAQFDLDIAISGAEIAEVDIEKANLLIRRANLQVEIANTARGFIVQEIDLILDLIGKPGEQREVTVTDENGEVITLKDKAVGRIGVMAYQTQYTLSTKLQAELAKAEVELAAAIKRENKAKKKAKRNKLIKAACRFIGSVVGAFFSAPALGAEIGAAMAEVAIGVLDNRPPGEILIGLADNAFSIAAAGGYDLEKELNDLGSKLGNELAGSLDKLEKNLEPLFQSLPKIVDKEMFTDTLQVLGLSEVKGVPALLDQTLDALKTDLREVKVGTVLKEAAAFDSVDQFKKHFAKNLLAKSTQKADELGALVEQVGKKWDQLQNDPDAQLAALERFGTMMLANNAAKIGEFRSGIIEKWVKEKKTAGGFWETPEVKEEGEALLKELFPNEEAFKTAKANVSAALLNPETHRGNIQKMLQPWQTEFDRLLAGVMDPGSPAFDTEVGALTGQVNHLNNAISQFKKENETGLFSWMIGKNNQQIIDLREKLSGLRQKDELQSLQVKIDEIGADVATMDLEEKRKKFRIAQKAIQIRELDYTQTELGVDIANLNNRIAQLSKSQADIGVDVKEASRSAAQERQLTAAAEIKKARFALEAARSSVEAARRKGAEAGRIRNALALPPLVLPDTAGFEVKRARQAHADALARALGAYREILRFCFSVELNDIPLLKRPDLPTSSAAVATWRSVFEEWSEDLSDSFINARLVGKIHATYETELTAHQIASLLSPNGLQLVMGSRLIENPELLVIGEKSLRESDQGGVEGEGPKLLADLREETLSPRWRRLLETAGITLSSAASFEKNLIEGGGRKYWLQDPKPDQVKVFAYDIATGRKIGPPGEPNWRIPFMDNVDHEKVSYEIEIEEIPLRVVVRRVPQKKFGTGRSNQPGEIVISSPDEVNSITGRLVGLFLKIEAADQSMITDDDYTWKVWYNGFVWLGDGYVQLNAPRELSPNRWVFEERGAGLPLDTLINHIAIETGTNDLKSFQVEGTPIRGTHVLRLLPEGINRVKPFERATLSIVYKSYS